jgi:hypothetical protein
MKSLIRGFEEEGGSDGGSVSKTPPHLNQRASPRDFFTDLNQGQDTVSKSPPHLDKRVIPLEFLEVSLGEDSEPRSGKRR